MRTSLLAAFALVIVTGCTTLRDRADTAFARGSYLEAATLYDQALAGDPKNASLQHQRDLARTGVLRGLLADTEAARHVGKEDVAIATLGRALDDRDRWGGVTPAAIAPQLATDVAAIGDDLAAQVAATTTSVGPLAGEALVHANDALLAHRELAARRTALLAATTEAGALQCQAIAPTATTPYWSWLVDRYCQHFGGPSLEVPALPNLAGSLAITGAPSGAPDPAALQNDLARAFRSSVWFAPGAPAMHATLSGSMAATFARAPITVSRDYTVSVPYTEDRTHEVPETETYTEDETTSDYVTDGDGNYHWESKTTPVTKTRTVLRTETEQVTVYRDETRTFTFTATQETARYSSELAVAFDPPTVVAATAHDVTTRGLDHDVTFAPASVVPQHDRLATLADFARAESASLQTELVARLDARYRDTYCTAASFTQEDAAACAYAGVATAPAAVHAELARTFGGDEAYLVATIAR